MNGPGLQAVRVVGGLVPPGLFAKVQAGELRDPASLSAASYHLAGRETLRDAANRSWTYLRGAWSNWREHAARTTGAGTGAARDQWLLVLMRELGYGQLPALRGGIGIDGVEYPVSHGWQHVPVHLLGPGVDLDRRNPGVAGAARAPQAMIQELLNRTEQHLWALLSNGLRLRLLRDSTALAGSAYVEFDLEAIFGGELFSEFLLLWQLCHVSRLEKRNGTDAPPTDCWLEAWHNEAVDSGARALRQLRDGVETALEALGTGFLQHPANDWLRNALRSNDLSTEDFHRALLRMAYRLLFLSVAEERDVLHDPAASAEAKERYGRYFSVGRLRKLSRIRSGGPHTDLWGSVTIILGALGGNGLKELGLPALAGLFDPADRAIGEQGTADHLLRCSLANVDLLGAMRALGWVAIRGQRIQPVDYRNLGSEELGSVYESLLELVPSVDLDEYTFRMAHLAGNERKTSGSYYTPSSLVSALLDSALDPLLDDAVKNSRDAQDAVRKLLEISVCDPACGSGHFLVAAARRIARRIAQQRSGEDEPTPEDVQHALREVVGHCIYGVDVNPMAAELAKVSLWMEAMEPGKPLGFLDARIRVGNSLLGATPALIAAGVPDEAFKEIEGDDKKVAAAWRKQNKLERQNTSFDEIAALPSNADLAAVRMELLEPAEEASTARHQAQRWQAYNSSDERLQRQRRQADAWSAAFVWKLTKNGVPAPTTGTVGGFISAPDNVDPAIRAEVQRLADEYRFFHWHLEFPEIFGVSGADEADASPEGWTGGFSCLLGNPPWERVKLQEQEFFAARDPEIATAPNKAARERLIKALLSSGSPGATVLHQAYLDAKRRAEGESVQLRSSGRFPLTGRGDVNTYAVFAETFRALTGPYGRSGVIVPTGIATDATTQYFFRALVESGSIAALYDFQTGPGLWSEIGHARYKFCLLTLTGRSAPVSEGEFAFFLRDVERLYDPGTRFSLSPSEILLLSPNTGTCPVFRTRRDAEITLDIYKRVPVLVRENDPGGNPWGVEFMRMFDMSNDSHLFRTREQLEADGWNLQGNVFIRGTHRMRPLYEGKMGHQFDSQFAEFVGTGDTDLVELGRTSPNRAPKPRYWVSEHVAAERLRRPQFRCKTSLLGHRRVARSTDEHTSLAAVIPWGAASYGWIISSGPDAPAILLLCAIYNSYALDYCLRNKLSQPSIPQGTSEQLPVIDPGELRKPCRWDGSAGGGEWIAKRSFELIYTNALMASFAGELGDDGPPFRWDIQRRALLRAELDAAFFHLYGVKRDDIDYILETFPIVKRKDVAKYGEYRTKSLILDVYDRMAEAEVTGEPYQTILDPPPGQGPRHPAGQA